MFLSTDQAVGLRDVSDAGSSVVLVPTKASNERVGLNCNLGLLLLRLLVCLLDVRDGIFRMKWVNHLKVNNVVSLIVPLLGLQGFGHRGHKDGGGLGSDSRVDDDLKVIDEDKVLNHDFSVVGDRNVCLRISFLTYDLLTLKRNRFLLGIQDGLLGQSFALQSDEHVTVENGHVVYVAVIVKV